MYRHGSFLLFAGLLASTNCSCGPGDDDIDGGSRDTGVAVADATGPDAFVADANLSDAGADGSADATVDGGVCITERLPLPAEPVCTLEEATCYCSVRRRQDSVPARGERQKNGDLDRDGYEAWIVSTNDHEPLRSGHALAVS